MKFKVFTLDIRIKQSGLKVSHSQVPSSVHTLYIFVSVKLTDISKRLKLFWFFLATEKQERELSDFNDEIFLSAAPIEA